MEKKRNLGHFVNWFIFNRIFGRQRLQYIQSTNKNKQTSQNCILNNNITVIINKNVISMVRLVTVFLIGTIMVAQSIGDSLTKIVMKWMLRIKT